MAHYNTILKQITVLIPRHEFEYLAATAKATKTARQYCLKHLKSDLRGHLEREPQ